MSEEASRRTLDEVITWLLQLEATDVEELCGVRAELERIAAEWTSWPLIQGLIREATTVLEGVVKGTAQDPARALAEVGEILEAVLAAQAAAPPEMRALAADPEPVPASTASSTPVAGSPPAGPVEPSLPSLPGAAAPAAPSAIDLDAATSAMDRIEIRPDVDAELLALFLDEGREYLADAETALLALEADPDDSEACNTVFRAFHTIKGTSAFLGLEAVSDLAHRAESILARVRDGTVRFAGPYAELAFRSVDMLKALVAVVEEARGGGVRPVPRGYADLLRALADPGSADLPPGDSTAKLEAAAPGEEGRTSHASASGQGTGGGGIAGEGAPGGSARSQGAAAQSVAGESAAGDGGRSGAPAAADSWVRVRTDRLDGLVDMIGELVIAHSILAEHVARSGNGDSVLVRHLAHAGKIVRELQDLSVCIRMVPLRSTFQRMARVVRDVAHKSGKQVTFVEEAGDTELDRNMVEILNDPLVHMIRNAVDHGIEPPEERIAKGKPPVGVVRLSAYQQGGSVVIELSDDGRGLDREKILAKARARGLVDSDRGLSDNELFNLIFEPGFSTASKVTDVSGRGVGMDVVRRHMEMVRGRIDITSEPGKGTTFALRLPLTLAITDGMVVRVGSERYILPTVSIHMSFRPTPDVLSTVVGRGEMVMVRGELLPIVRLHRLFQIADAATDPTAALLVVIGAGGRRCALLVDELLAHQQVVAKSLGAGLGAVPGLSGCAILGDGRVGLILDPAQIIALGRRGGLEPGPGEWQAVA